MKKTIDGFRLKETAVEALKNQGVSVMLSIAVTVAVMGFIVSSMKVYYNDSVTDSENENIARYYLESLPIKLAQGEAEEAKEKSGTFKTGKKIAGLIIGDDLVNMAESAVLEVKKTHFKVRLFDFGSDDGDTVILSSGTDTIEVKLSKDVSENKIEIKDGHFTIEAKRDADKKGVTVAIMAQNKDGEKPVFLPVLQEGQRFVVEIK